MNKDFLDTNVIVYANDNRDRTKQNRAIEIITHAMQTGTGVVSVQVLQEYTNVAIRKLKQRQDVVMRQLILLEGLETVAMTPPLVRRALELSGLYQLSFWDAGIVAAAEKSGCVRILSEDFGSGRFFGPIQAVNPFAGAFQPGG